MYQTKYGSNQYGRTEQISTSVPNQSVRAYRTDQYERIEPIDMGVSGHADSPDLRSAFNGFLGLNTIMAEEISTMTMDDIQKIGLNDENIGYQSLQD